MIFFSFGSDFVVAQDVSQNLVFNVFSQSHFCVLVVGAFAPFGLVKVLLESRKTYLPALGGVRIFQ